VEIAFYVVLAGTNAPGSRVLMCDISMC